jgi:UDP-N-acetylglucosamine 2-epimerase (non-hydrolysing)
MKKLRVVTVVGTRPEIIRLSRTIVLLDKSMEHILVHTGQNYDYELNQIFFDDLSLRKPDVFLNAAGLNAAKTISNVISKFDDFLDEYSPIQIAVCRYCLLKEEKFLLFIWKQEIVALI